MFAKMLFSVLATGLFSTASFAGDQYVDGIGYAVSGYDVVAYFDLARSTVGTSQPEGIPGRAELTPNITVQILRFRPKPIWTGFWRVRQGLRRTMTGIAPMVWRRVVKFRATRTCGGSWMASCI